MKFLRNFKYLLIIFCLTAQIPISVYAAPAMQDDGDPAPQDVQVTVTRRVNVPYFADRVRNVDSAIFWFGRVTPSENYADVRLGYTASTLVVRLHVIDRLIWRDNTPTPAELTLYDAASLYLSLDGNTGSAPDSHDYRFIAQFGVSAGDPAFQAVYRGENAAWSPADTSFTATSGWRGNAPNDMIEDRGWTLEYNIPFSSLGLSAAPPNGTVWGLALTLYDRDDAAGTPIAAKSWPEGMSSTQPSTWGQLVFGLPTYTPPNVPSSGSTIIRQGLNGAVVPDAGVGGDIGRLCPGDSYYIWNLWGNANFAGGTGVNLQNQGDIADWPCFSKYYITFPLNQLPPNKAILSATLTLHHWGGSDPNQALRSLIQVFTVAEDWQETTLTWNNAPLAVENVSRAWVDVVASCNWPCVARTWDVSRAVAQAYEAGTPLRLALYEADEAYHSGKYFTTSDEGEWNAVGRPTLTVVWGEAPGALRKTVWPIIASQGDTVTFTLNFNGIGQNLTLTDMLPNGLGAPIGLNASSGQAQYNPATRTITWTGAPVSGLAVTLTYSTMVQASGRQALINQAQLLLPDGSSTAQASVIVDGSLLFLPLARR